MRHIIVAVAAMLAGPAFAGDTCRLPTVVQCTLLACSPGCRVEPDGVRYCDVPVNCNKCEPDPSQYQCMRDDGSTYSKPMFDIDQQRALAR